MHKQILTSREISWLSFNSRVLQEANDPSMSLKERIRFLGIFSNNQDEFFRIMVAFLKRIVQFKTKKFKHYPGENPQKILNQIHRIVLQQQYHFNSIWEKIIEELKSYKILFIDDKHLNSKQKDFIKHFFDENISHTIIPLFIENLPQLPSFGDNHIFLGIVMKKDSTHHKQKFAIIEIPTKHYNRFVFLPSRPGEQNIMLLEDVIRFNLAGIFSHMGYTHFEAHMFKVTKDAEIDIENDFSTNLIAKIRKGLKNRRIAMPTRFLYDKEMNKDLLAYLIHKLNIHEKNSIIPSGRIRNFHDFMNFPAILPNDRPRLQPFKHPILAKSLRVFDVIMKQDVLLHFPFHSFDSIIDLLREAAMDEDVKSIKITAYRLASNSKICNALINAVRNGKRVHVVLELRASFDEEANLEWKAKLEEEGVKVFLGIPQKKVHAKICVIKKKVGDKEIEYGFIGTGNLNEKTALSYTDHCLLTSHRLIMADINRIFKYLEKPGKNLNQLNLCKTLLISPTNMRKKISTMIDREIEVAKAGKFSEMIINLNLLSDKHLINKLYKAAASGIEVHLIIRSIFCFPMQSKHLVQPKTIISIVDKYLEHSRIWLFHNNDNEEIYISSADWTVRNLDNRIEVAVPIIDSAIRDELKHILNIKLNDNVKARKWDSNLSNQYVSSAGKKKIRSQIAIYHYLKKKDKSHEN